MLSSSIFQSYDCNVVIFHFIYENNSTKYIKMGDLKHISHKQFNEFIKGKGFKRKNYYKLSLCTIEERQ